MLHQIFHYVRSVLHIAHMERQQQFLYCIIDNSINLKFSENVNEKYRRFGVTLCCDHRTQFAQGEGHNLCGFDLLRGPAGLMEVTLSEIYGVLETLNAHEDVRLRLAWRSCWSGVEWSGQRVARG